MDSRSKQEEMEGTYFICFDFVSEQRCFLNSRPSFRSARLSFVLCSFGCALYAVLGSLMKQTFNGNVNEYNGCVSLRYNSLFISLPLPTKGHQNNNVK